MTLDEIRAAWLRWMHRKDVTADLDVVQVFAETSIVNRLMYPAPEAGWATDDLVEQMPVVWLHAGMMYLHELAQDDEGLAREARAFTDAIRDWHFRNSIDTSDAQMETDTWA